MAPCARCKKRGLNKKQCPKGSICKACIAEIINLLHNYKIKAKKFMKRRYSIKGYIDLKDQRRRINPWIRYLPKYNQPNRH